MELRTMVIILQTYLLVGIEDNSSFVMKEANAHGSRQVLTKADVSPTQMQKSSALPDYS